MADNDSLITNTNSPATEKASRTPVNPKAPKVMSSAAKKKIWLLIDSRSFGGIESHIAQLAPGLNTDKERVTVVLMKDYGDHPLRTALRNEAVDVLMLNGGFFSMLQKMRACRPSLIHTHGYKAGILGRIAARMCAIPVLSTFHAGEQASGISGVPGKMDLYDWLDRHTAFLASQTYAVSHAIAARLPTNAKVIDNFVQTTAVELSKGNQIAFVGRLSHEKGPDTFSNIAAALPDLSFDLYGDGPMSDEIEASKPTNLHCYGHQADMAKVWPEVGLLIMPSRAEGLPMAALEAMARGIPVIAFSVGNLGSLIHHNENGWLVEPGNTDTLVKVINHWASMGEPGKDAFRSAARKTIENRFSRDVVLPNLLRDYHFFSK